SDEAYTLLRVRLPSGELRQVMVYAAFWNERATARSILEYLLGVRPTRAIPFAPARATLVVQAWPDQRREGCRPADPTLLPSLARPRPEAFRWAKTVEGAELDAWAAKLPGYGGEGSFCTARQAYRVALSPWLPGAD